MAAAFPCILGPSLRASQGNGSFIPASGDSSGQSAVMLGPGVASRVGSEHVIFLNIWVFDTKRSYMTRGEVHQTGEMTHLVRVALQLALMLLARSFTEGSHSFSLCHVP
ncbi:hypothetical protein BD309DRAFT_360938 [Dichomitus squalens]|uniref:Uncharacterized protein n=1 Tax=Dichomitus squalens TaxID=114155 RepID=A0A4Q9QAX8_9APHY|nr:hypothetical protein BD309DRAFT_360938 [Dichomitus squalens]TBU64430.1 hypothetical protein BD310DRAFT_397426 [Dichomitus squalens]